MHLLDLPEEVLLAILSDLGVRDLLTFSSANHYTKKFFDNSSRLQYIAELDAAGCIDPSLHPQYREAKAVISNASGATVAWNISERLKYLRTREARWQELDLLKNARRIPLSRSQQVSIYDLSGGVFAFAETQRECDIQTIDLREVSRRGRGVELDERGPVKLPPSDVPWETFAFDMDVADFGFALKEHDLFVLVSFVSKDHDLGPANMEGVQDIKLNVYQFSSHLLHPLAKEPILKLAEKPMTYRRPSPIIEVSGKYIVVMLNFPRAIVRRVVEDLFVYNWQSGRLIYHQTYGEVTYCGLAFVTPSLFVMPNTQCNALDLFHIFLTSDGIERVCLLQRLCLPEPVRGFMLRSASCRGDPNPTSTTPDCLNPRGHTMDPGTGDDVRGRTWGSAGFGISADPLRAIISFNYIILYEEAAIPVGPSVNLVVHRSTLARLALDGLDERKSTTLSKYPNVDDGIPETKWEDWGPGVTRWRLEDDLVEWVTTTAGQRQVISAHTSTSPWCPVIIIRDYNPYEVRRAREREGVHVDSRDGERTDDSEDENESGVGAEAEHSGEVGVGVGADGSAVASADAVQSVDWVAAANTSVDAYIDPDLDLEMTPGVHEGINADSDSEAFSPGPTDDAVEIYTDFFDWEPVHLPHTDHASSLDDFLVDHNTTNSRLRRTSVRVRDTTPKSVAQYFAKKEVKGGLPCVEYTIEGDGSLYTGLLMDEERIIGYLELDMGDPAGTEKMHSLSVFSMYP